MDELSRILAIPSTKELSQGVGLERGPGKGDDKDGEQLTEAQ